MIKYLGSKRLLVPRLVGALTAGGARTALDLFSGTSRVGHALKRAGLRVHANDHNAYAHAFARCYVAADARRWRAPAARLLAELDALPGVPGWFTETYAVRSRYLRPENAARVDAIRARIATLVLEPELEAIALTSLVEAADRLDSPAGGDAGARPRAGGHRAQEPRRGGRPRRLHSGRADGVPEAVGRARASAA